MSLLSLKCNTDATLGILRGLKKDADVEVPSEDGDDNSSLQTVPSFVAAMERTQQKNA